MSLMTPVLFDSGPLYSTYTQRAIQQQTMARAQGTNDNMRMAVRHYVAFCSLFQVHPATPSVQDLCILVEYLSDLLKSPGSILNYVSLLRRHARDCQDDTTPWFSHRLTLALDAVARDKCHIPLQRPPITPDLLYRAFKYLAPRLD